MNVQIYEEATHWLIAHRGDGLDRHQKIQFDTWLRRSPQHLQAYLEMSAVWEDVRSLEPGWNPTSNELIEQAHNEDNVLRLPPPDPPLSGAGQRDRSATAVA